MFKIQGPGGSSKFQVPSSMFNGLREFNVQGSKFKDGFRRASMFREFSKRRNVRGYAQSVNRLRYEASDAARATSSRK